MSERALLLTGVGNETERAAATPFRYEVAFEADVGVAEWDAFVIAAGGHHAQSSTWADVKRVLGWSGTRLVVRDRGETVAGAQVLVRDVGRFGRVGTCAHGPIVTRDEPRLIEAIHRGLIELSHGERIRYLKAQPPAGSSNLESGLRAHGWTPSSMPAAPSATVRVDLTAPEEEILARMRQATRKTIRRGEKRGLVVREGGRGDFDAYHRIIEATSHRQGFTPYPRRYYETLWEAFAERDGSCLVLAELDDVAHAATLVIGFGEAATCKMGGWSGERSRVRPNEPMHFAAMRWAKRIGCEYYDFDGIDRRCALAVLRDGELPEDQRHSVAHFKLGFGGEVVLLSETLDIGPGPFMRPLVRVGAPHVSHLQSLAHRVAGRGQ